jgi:hypothetical protein
LFVAVEPSKEQSRALCLLTVVGATHIEQHVGIKPEKLLYDADNGLCYLYVAWRLCVIWIRKVEPKSCVIWVTIQFEINEILDAIVGFETVNLTIAPHLVRSIDIDAGNVEVIHYFMAIS